MMKKIKFSLVLLSSVTCMVASPGLAGDTNATEATGNTINPMIAETNQVLHTESIVYVKDLGVKTSISGIRFEADSVIPDQMVGSTYAIYLSEDGVTWTNLVAEGSFPEADAWPFTAWPSMAHQSQFIMVKGLQMHEQTLVAQPVIESPEPELYYDYNEETVSIYCPSDCEAFVKSASDDEVKPYDRSIPFSRVRDGLTTWCQCGDGVHGPEIAIEAPAAFINQVKFKSYAGMFEELPDFDHLTPAQTGHLSRVELISPQPGHPFAMRFEGQLRIFSKDTYTISMASDDGSRLYLDDTLLIDNDGLHPVSRKEVKQSLKPGSYPIRIEYFDAGGEAILDVEIK